LRINKDLSARITKDGIFISRPQINIEASNLKNQLRNSKVPEDAEEDHMARRQDSKFKTKR